MQIRQNKVMGYLAVTAGVGCVSSVASAAVVFYGNAGNTNIRPDPIGINFGISGGLSCVDVSESEATRFAFSYAVYRYFSRGLNLTAYDSGKCGFYANAGTFRSGAVAGDQNYANISFNGNDRIYEAVAQFYLDGSGGGYLMAIATTNPIPNPQDLSAVGGTALSISSGKAMIDVAAVPEPSSLVLLALGATGLAARRQRKKAA